MSVERLQRTGGRTAARREATRSEILAAAWGLARDQGLTGWTMRDLGARVGMSAQSLYGYFDAKHDIYDALFADGYRAFTAHMAGEDDDDPVAAARTDAHRFFSFCVEDPVRFQLLFLRTIPGFTPSERSYALAIDVLTEMGRRSARAGVRSDLVDLWTAVMTGLASQQIANDPGGDRWQRLVDEAVDMLLAHTVRPATRTTTRTGARRTTGRRRT